MRYFCTLLIVLASSLCTLAEMATNQQITVNGEAVISFRKPDNIPLETITKIVSIDKVKGDLVTAYVNQSELNSFITLGIPFEEVKKVRSNITMYRGKWRNYDFTSYPSYDDYISIMNGFAESYPNLCSVEKLGTSVQGRDIIAVKISDNVDTDEPEAKFYYNSTIHGDETAGYVLMLRLIDSLLSNYGQDTRITNLVDSLEIWINPLSNPDGTYRGGNHTVQSSQRYNSNNVDLNRNFPCPSGNSTGSIQKETQCQMDFYEAHPITLAADIHGGVELVCYPWGCWQKNHPDQQWFREISKEYCDLAQQNSPYGYFDDEGGTINGFDWYPVYGEMMNYTLYNSYCRLITLELNKTKTLPASSLQSHWEYNSEAFLHLLEESYNGVHGIITKYPDNEPVEAKIVVSNHDDFSQNSEVYSQAGNGGFHRIINPGTYTLEITADGMYDTTVQVTVTDANPVFENIQLIPVGMSVLKKSVENKKELILTHDLLTVQGDKITVFNLLGREIIQIHGRNGVINWKYKNHLPQGTYAVSVESAKGIQNQLITIQ